MSKILKMENGCPVIVDMEQDEESVEIENRQDEDKDKRKYRMNPKPFRGVNKTDNGNGGHVILNLILNLHWELSTHE